MLTCNVLQYSIQLLLGYGAKEVDQDAFVMLRLNRPRCERTSLKNEFVNVVRQQMVGKTHPNQRYAPGHRGSRYR